MPTEHNKKILIVAYHFPPDAAVGAIRPAKFAKYLPEFGWEPHILTIREKYIEKIDETRLADVAGTQIHRTPFWRTPLQLSIDIRDRLRGYQSDVVIRGLPPSNNPENAFNKHESLCVRLKRYFVALNFLPDDKLWWTIPAVIAGYRMIRRERIHHIYATAPPPTVAIIGYILSVLTGAKLILDLRDPWITGKGPPPAPMCWSIVEGWKRQTERAVMSRAHSVICTTDSFKQVLSDHYSDLQPEKFITITNGYDVVDLAARPEKKSKKFIITYLGTFYMGRNPKAFLQAVSQIIQQQFVPENAVEVRLIGDVKYAGGESVREMVAHCGLDSVVRFLGFVPHGEAMQQMASSDLLLLLAPNQAHQIPAKAFEYVGARQPILALTDEGATADLVRSLNAGLVVSQEDVVGIIESLKIFYAEHQQESARWYNGADPSLFERRNLTAQFVQCLDAADQPQASQIR